MRSWSCLSPCPARPDSKRGQSPELKAHGMAHGKLKIAAAVAGSWLLLAAGVIVLSAQEVVTPQMALLMLVALTGLYVGFGVLIAVYRFMSSLK